MFEITLYRQYCYWKLVLAISVCAGGAIALSSSGNIATGDLVSASYSSRGNAGNGGAVFLSTRDGDIVGFPTGKRFPVLASVATTKRGTAGNGGDVRLEAQHQVKNLEILTLSSSSQSGSIQVKGFGDLSVNNASILTSKQLTVYIRVRPRWCLEKYPYGHSLRW